MQCNIDRRGRRVRMGWGALMMVLALLCVAGAWVGWGWGLWVAAGLFAAFGVFAIYEARKGWCAVRAMGFKTPV